MRIRKPKGRWPTRAQQTVIAWTDRAGTGTYARPTAIRRINLGPDSAAIGWESATRWRVDTPTVTDCHVILGYVNPDYFLGGEIRLETGASAAGAEGEESRSPWE